MKIIFQLFLLVSIIAVYCSADEKSVSPDEPFGPNGSHGPFGPGGPGDVNPFSAFKDLQSYLAFVKSMSSDPTVADFLKESKPEIDIYDHVKAVMEQYARDRNNEIKYKSSVIVDQPNYPRVVNVYIEKDGATLTCELQISEKQTFTDFEDFTLKCLDGQRFSKTKVASA